MLKFKSNIFSISTHDSLPLVATATLDGTIYCHNYSTHELLFQNSLSSDSIRSIIYFNNSSSIITASSDKSIRIVDCHTGKLMLRKPNAHPDSINIVAQHNQTLVSADDSGNIKLWDLRSRKNIYKYSTGVDYVSDIISIEDKIYSTNGNGYLSCLDTKTMKITTSEDQEDELTSICRFQNKKLLVGTESGVVLVFNTSDINDHIDRWVGHAESISGLYNKDGIVYSCCDGIIKSNELDKGFKMGKQVGKGEIMEFTKDNGWVSAMDDVLYINNSKVNGEKTGKVNAGFYDDFD